MQDNHEQKGTIAFFMIIVMVLIYVVIKAKEREERTPVMGVMEAEEWQIASQESCKILELRVKEGDYVRVGDTLVIMRPAGVEPSSLSKAKKTESEIMFVEQTKAALDKAKKEFENAEKLYADGIINATERNEVLANYKALEAQVRAAETRGLDNGERALIARREGEVSGVLQHEGERVDSGQPLLKVMDIDNIWATCTLPEEVWEDVGEGDTLDVYIKPLNQNVDMTVSEIKFDKMRMYPISHYRSIRPGMEVKTLIP